MTLFFGDRKGDQTLTANVGLLHFALSFGCEPVFNERFSVQRMHFEYLTTGHVITFAGAVYGHFLSEVNHSVFGCVFHFELFYFGCLTFVLCFICFFLS